MAGREQKSKERIIKEKHAKEKEEIDQKEYEDAVRKAHLAQKRRSKK